MLLYCDFVCPFVISQIQSILDGGELMDEGPGGLPNNPEELGGIIEAIEGKITQTQTQLTQEKTKIERYRVSNVLSTHCE